MECRRAILYARAILCAPTVTVNNLIKLHDFRLSPLSALQTMDLKVADLRKILNKLLFKSQRKVLMTRHLCIFKTDPQQAVVQISKEGKIMTFLHI